MGVDPLTAVVGSVASAGASKLLGGGKKSGGGGQQQLTAFESLPPEFQDLLLGQRGEGGERIAGTGILGRTQELAGQTQPFTPSQIAGLSALEQQGLTGLADAGAGLPQQFQQGLVSDTQPFRPSFNFGQRASEAFGQGQGLLQQGATPISGQEIQTGISQFMNPFEAQVVANAAREAQQAGQGLLSGIAGEATGAGAFGGERQALLESKVPELVAQQVGDLSARLRQAGFESAASKGLQNLQFGRSAQLQAGTALGGLGSQLFGARQGVQGIQSQQAADERARLASQAGLAGTQSSLAGRQVAAGQLPRTLEQAGLQREAQIAGIPLQQLELLKGTLGTITPFSGAGVMQQQGIGTGGQILNALGVANQFGGVGGLGQGILDTFGFNQPVGTGFTAGNQLQGNPFR